VHPAHAALEHLREIGAAPGHREQHVAADLGREIAAVGNRDHGGLRELLADPREHRHGDVGQDAHLALVGHCAFPPPRARA
jgi:hypothetical protein